MKQKNAGYIVPADQISNQMAKNTYAKTPTATAASRKARLWSMSRNASGRIVAVFRGCLYDVNIKIVNKNSSIVSIKFAFYNYECFSK